MDTEEQIYQKLELRRVIAVQTIELEKKNRKKYAKNEILKDKVKDFDKRIEKLEEELKEIKTKIFGLPEYQKLIKKSETTKDIEAIKVDTIFSLDTDKELIRLSIMSGMPPRYLAKTVKMAAETKTMVSFRPISKGFLELPLLYKDLFGKNIFIKGKSSEEDVIFGLIPVNPFLSKSRYDDTKGYEDIKKEGEIDFDEIIKKQKDIIKYEKERLKLDIGRYEKEYGKDSDIVQNTREYLKKLEQVEKSTRKITKIAAKNKNGNEIYVLTKKANDRVLDKENKIIFLEKREDGKFYYQDTREEFDPKQIETVYKKELVEIYAYEDENGNKYPIGPDIDLFSCGASKALKEDMETREILSKAEASQKGIVNKVDLRVLNAMNGVTEYKEICTHGPEHYNPSPEQIADMTNKFGGYLFIIPSLEGGSEVEVKLLKNEDQILKLYNELQQKKGFKIPINPDWGWVMRKGELIKNKYRIFIKEYKRKIEAIKTEDIKEEAKKVIKKIQEINKKLSEESNKQKDVDKLLVGYKKQKTELLSLFEKDREMVKKKNQMILPRLVKKFPVKDKKVEIKKDKRKSRSKLIKDFEQFAKDGRFRRIDQIKRKTKKREIRSKSLRKKGDKGNRKNLLSPLGRIKVENVGKNIAVKTFNFSNPYVLKEEEKLPKIPEDQRLRDIKKKREKKGRSLSSSNYNKNIKLKKISKENKNKRGGFQRY